MRVLVLGGGVVGVTAAYYLAREGHEVTLIERRAEAASETSYGNAGFVSPGDSYAWASPGALKLFLKSLYKRDLGIKVTPRLDPRLWSWSWQFLLQCTNARARINSLRKLRLALYSRACIDDLAATTGIDYDARSLGMLYFFRSQESLDHGVAHMRLLADHGLALEVVDRAGLVRHDPGLAAAQDRLAGGLFSPGDQTGDSCKFTRRLADWCAAQQGVRFAYRTNLRGIETAGDRIARVVTDQGVFDAECYVVALGPETPLVVKGLGLRLPIYPVKGYSATVPLRDAAQAPSLGCVDEDNLIGCSRLGGRIRLACRAEFAGYDRSHRASDFTRLLQVARELFPGGGDWEQAEYWAGLRPMTPSSVPVLGRARYANLYLNVGHGHVGWTLACGSGRLLADLIAGRAPEIDPEGLLYEA